MKSSTPLGQHIAACHGATSWPESRQRELWAAISSSSVEALEAHSTGLESLATLDYPVIAVSSLQGVRKAQELIPGGLVTCALHSRTQGEMMTPRPEFAHLSALHLSGQVDASWFEWFSLPGALPRLRELSISELHSIVSSEGYRAWTPEVFERWLRTHELFALEGLELCECHLDASHAEYFIHLDRFSRLHTLELSGNRFDNLGVQRLFDSCVSHHMLRELSMSYVCCGAQGVQALVDHPCVSQLESLRLSHNRLGDEGLDRLSHGDVFEGLRSLSLREIGATAKGIAMLAHGELCRGLVHMNLRQNQCDDHALEALCDAGLLDGLEVLDLDQNKVSSRGAARLAREPGARSLRELYLNDNDIDREGAIALLESPYLGRLKLLMLDDNCMDDECIADVLTRVPSTLDDLYIGSASIKAPDTLFDLARQYAPDLELHLSGYMR